MKVCVVSKAELALQNISGLSCILKLTIIEQVLNTATRVKILDETEFISHSTNTLGKGMNPIILPPAMGK